MTKKSDQAETKPSQFVKFSFFKFSPEWRRLSASDRAQACEEFAEVISQWSGSEGRVMRTYSLVGIRPDADLMLWQVSYRLEDHHELGAALRRTSAGPYFDEPYGYLAMTKRSIYVDVHEHENQEGSRLEVVPGKAKYLFVYPFVKTRAWYSLSAEVRQRAMTEHIKLGHDYPSVKINTTYSFGLDDQEFVVAFESDRPIDFLDLVMELRHTEASAYTERDVPVFTCLAMPIDRALASI